MARRKRLPLIRRSAPAGVEGATLRQARVEPSPAPDISERHRMLIRPVVLIHGAEEIETFLDLECTCGWAARDLEPLTVPEAVRLERAHFEQAIIAAHNQEGTA